MNTEKGTSQEIKSPLPSIFFLVTIFFVSLSFFLLVEIFRDQLYFIMSPTTYLVFHNFIEIFSAVVLFSIFSVGALSYRQSQDDHLFFLSCMFLGVGLIDIMHALSFPGMPAFITQSSTNKGILFWISARLLFAVALLLSAFIAQRASRSKLWKLGVLATPIIFSAIVFVAAIYYEQALPAMFVPGLGLTSLKINLEYLVVGILVLAYLAYLRRFLKTREKVFLLYLAAITISIFSELSFTLYKSAYDTFNALGHVYKFAIFCFIFWGIYTTAVLLPYRKLSLLAKKSGMKNSLWFFLVALWGACIFVAPPVLAATTTATTTLAATTATATVSKTPGALLFLGNKNIAPVVYLEGSTPTGVAVDIVRALAKHIPEPIDIEAMDWTTAQTLVAEGQADALIQINSTEARKKIYDFSDPLLESHFSIFTNTNRVGIAGIPSLEGLRVGVEASGLPQQLLSIDPQITLAVIPNFLDAFKQLNAGSIDAVVVDERVGSYIIAQNRLRGIKITGDPISPSYSALAVKKGNTKLLDEINKALQAIKADGTYQSILDKWKPKEAIFVTQEEITRNIYYAIIFGLFLLLLTAGIWLIFLRRELKKRRVAEKAEQKAEKYVEKIINSANAMIVGLDTAGKVTVFNDAAEKITGYRRDEVMSLNLFELVVPRQRFPEVWKAFEELRKKGKSIVGDFQNPILTKSGEERMIEWRNSDLRDAGSVIGTISYGIDITERKQAENLLLEERSLFITGPTVVFKWRAAEHWPVEYVSPNVKDQFGYAPNELASERFHYDEVVHPDDIARIADEVESYSKNGTVSFKQEYRIRRKDGVYRWVDDFTTVIRNKRGVITHYLGYLIDITERKLEEERLKELDRLKDDFLSVTTHELKTPLVPIKSQSQLLLAGDYGRLNQKQKEAIEMIYRNGEVLNTLSSEVLDIAKIKSNKLKLVPEKTRLDKVITEAVGDMKIIARQKHLRLSLLPVPEIPEMMIDGSRIRQVLTNLLDNAIKFTPEKGQIGVEVKNVKNEIEVQVKDSGIGLSKKNLTKLFTPFFQVESDVARKYRGTGLGLVICKGIIEAHGGKIWAESEGEGKGSRFIFSLPIK